MTKYFPTYLCNQLPTYPPTYLLSLALLILSVWLLSRAKVKSRPCPWPKTWFRQYMRKITKQTNVKNNDLKQTTKRKVKKKECTQTKTITRMFLKMSENRKTWHPLSNFSVIINKWRTYWDWAGAKPGWNS